jgi:pimeloyl-ACP methyl ester carboxylesterase
MGDDDGKRWLTTDDGVRLRYHDRGAFNAGLPAVVFLHGWSANGRWFDRNVDLARTVRMVTLDYRGMGESDHPGHGFRVSRLAADVRCLLLELNIASAVLVGTSLGFTVIANYLELYGYDRAAGVAFVDQSACMYSKPGWCTGAPELSNAALVADLNAALVSDFGALADGIISGGFGVTPPSDVERSFFKSQILKCDPRALGALMYDHANLDMRDYLPRVRCPVLNFIGGATKCHAIAGIAYIGETCPRGRNVTFERAGHWLYWEESARFNGEILEFVEMCAASARKPADAEAAQ